jgi:hypothetical protein
MISRLNTKDFNERLKDNTKFGNPKIKGTPFAGYVKPGELNKKFFGEYDDSTFRLTKNSSAFPIPYIIQGRYESISDSETKVSIEIIPISFGFYWIRLFPLTLLIIFYGSYFFEDSKFELDVFVGLNIFILVMFSPILIVKQMKKRLINRFITTFEIIEKE